MAEASTTAAEPGKVQSGVATPKSPREHAINLRLTPVNNSNQPVVANTSAVQLAPGMAYIDFGFIEPNVLAALPRVAQEGGTLPKEIAGTLAVRVAMGFDGLAALQQQLMRVMQELAKVAKEQAGGKS